MDMRLKHRKETQTKRKTQLCKVFSLKLDKSHLNRGQSEYLHRVFLEAKWFYNYLLSHKKIADADTKAKIVPVKLKDGSFEDRTIEVLPAQSKQGLQNRIFSSIKTLGTLKKQGKKIGRLRFRSRVESIPLPATGEHGAYHVLRETNGVYVAKCPKAFRVNGMEQIPDDAELANANLISRNGDYYLQVTCFLNKDEKYIEKQHALHRNRKDKAVGLDFGCTTQLTGFDNSGSESGFKIQFEVPADKRLRRLCRKVSRKKKETKNRLRARLRMARRYEHLSNVKRDIRNKVVKALTDTYETIVVQDENIKGWQAGGHGKKIQTTGIGGIMAALKNKAHTLVEVDRFAPTTKTCSMCGSVRKMEQQDRVYECECGAGMDRDVNAARNILTLGLIKDRVPTERRESALGETLTTTDNLTDRLRLIPRVVCKPGSLNQEAPAFRRG